MTGWLELQDENRDARCLVQSFWKRKINNVLFPTREFQPHRVGQAASWSFVSVFVICQNSELPPADSFFQNWQNDCRPCPVGSSIEFVRVLNT